MSILLYVRTNRFHTKELEQHNKSGVDDWFAETRIPDNEENTGRKVKINGFVRRREASLWKRWFYLSV